LIKETEGSEEFPSGSDEESGIEETEGFGTLAEGALDTGDSTMGSLGPEGAELGTDSGSFRNERIWLADQSIDGL